MAAGCWIFVKLSSHSRLSRPWRLLGHVRHHLNDMRLRRAKLDLHILASNHPRVGKTGSLNLTAASQDNKRRCISISIFDDKLTPNCLTSVYICPSSIPQTPIFIAGTVVSMYYTNSTTTPLISPYGHTSPIPLLFLFPCKSLVDGPNLFFYIDVLHVRHVSGVWVAVEALHCGPLASRRLLL